MNRGMKVAGAMGLASWRVRAALDEHQFGQAASGAHVSVHAGALSAGPISGPLSLNEVGVTDTAVAVLWMFGPKNVAHSVSAPAENQYLGADIAFVDHDAKRILLYQAKLASWNGVAFSLKTQVTATQVGMLASPSVTLSGVTYDLSGHVALYQNAVGVPPYGSNLSPSCWRATALSGLTGAIPSPKAARHLSALYYDNVLDGPFPWSPCGVLSAHVPASNLTSQPVGIATVDAMAVTPWEFAFEDWWSTGEEQRDREADVSPAREPGRVAADLREAAGLADTQGLFVIEL